MVLNTSKLCLDYGVAIGFSITYEWAKKKQGHARVFTQGQENIILYKMNRDWEAES